MTKRFSMRRLEDAACLWFNDNVLDPFLIELYHRPEDWAGPNAEQYPLAAQLCSELAGEQFAIAEPLAREHSMGNRFDIEVFQWALGIANRASVGPIPEKFVYTRQLFLAER